MSDLIRREDVFKAIVGLTTYKTVGDIEILCEASVADSEGWLGGIRDALKEVECIPSSGTEQRWIPVTESLPKDGERVLITHKGGVFFGWYNGSYWERGAPTNHRPLQTVIAWMPLPESYRGE